MIAIPVEEQVRPGAASMLSALAASWPALILATVCLLPFLNKAFVLDDPHFLGMAQQILKHPMHPMDFQICWNLTEDCTKAYVLTPGNALMGYALLPTILGGAREWIAHGTQLLFAFIAIVSMSSLVLRFGWDRNHATLGALLLVAIPPFLPMASTAMPDVLAMAVGLVAMERLAAWKAERKWSQAVAAAIALGLAGFARSHLALLLPLGAFFLLESADPRRILPYVRRKRALWAPVLGGGILLFAIIFLTRERSLGLDPPPVFSGPAHIPVNLLSYLLYLAFPIPLAVWWVLCRWHTRRDRVAAAFVMAAIFSALALNFRLVALLAALGLGALADLLMEAWRKRQHRQLFLLFWILVPLPIIYYGHLPLKYLLPCLPAIILICFELGAVFPARIVRASCILLIGVGTVYSVVILHSDAEFADFGRDAMNRLIRPEVSAGRRVWYTGSFSSYWYAGKAGATLSVTGGPRPKPGDRLVVGAYEEAGRPNSLARFPDRTLLETISHEYSFGRTMGGGMGLYTNMVGFWPWGFGKSDWDRYELWTIAAPTPGLSAGKTPN